VYVCMFVCVFECVCARARTQACICVRVRACICRLVCFARALSLYFNLRLWGLDAVDVCAQVDVHVCRTDLITRRIVGLVIIVQAHLWVCMCCGWSDSGFRSRVYCSVEGLGSLSLWLESKWLSQGVVGKNTKAWRESPR
jgi:hypothetical protein